MAGGVAGSAGAVGAIHTLADRDGQHKPWLWKIAAAPAKPRLAWAGHCCMITRVRRLIPILLLLSSVVFSPRAEALLPTQVAVLFNSTQPESRELAEAYAAARNIPPGRLVGLAMSAEADISREEYELTIRDPLRAHFDEMGWRARAPDRTSGITLPVRNGIRVIAIMRGTPLRILPVPRGEDAPAREPGNPIAHRDEASVDSELALFGLDGVPVEGILQNRYYSSREAFVEANLPFMVLTSRIDGPGLAVCKRMILDAVAVEQTGLWGMAYVDFSNKFPMGDEWLEQIVAANRKAGIPTVTDRFDPTLPTHYPMGDAAWYYGWYDPHVSGPFLNPRFRFRRGAVAVHIHSFSAEQIGNPARHWVAPLLAAGAAATVGNVFEPYLELSHHLEILHDRLLAGFTLAEAAWMAMPCASWQGVVLGDPLYRPFRGFPAGGEVAEADRDFRALAMARQRWPDDDGERRAQLAAAVERTRSGTLAEALALEWIDANDEARAGEWLDRAAGAYEDDGDRLRLVFHQVAMRRHVGDTAGALTLLREAAAVHGERPEAKALEDWIELLDPPAAP